MGRRGVSEKIILHSNTSRPPNMVLLLPFFLEGVSFFVFCFFFCTTLSCFFGGLTKQLLTGGTVL